MQGQTQEVLVELIELQTITSLLDIWKVMFPDQHILQNCQLRREEQCKDRSESTPAHRKSERD